MSGTNSSFSLYHLTDPAGWCAVIGAVPVRTLYEFSVLYHEYREMTKKRDGQKERWILKQIVVCDTKLTIVKQN